MDAEMVCKARVLQLLEELLARCSKIERLLVPLKSEGVLEQDDGGQHQDDEAAA